jgi:ABC-type transport system involved in Fe-S cluster assembly fused permease/ATPase subunit
VKQNAFAQVAQFTFRHLHNLSLQWHLQKKMGNVLRSMDRGIASADTVVSAIFLYMLPSLVECSIVFVIFYLHFDQPLLSVIIFSHVVLYIVVTVQITIWRKKFKRATNKHDNEFHDRATDSLINYETIKYFGNEEFESERYTEAVKKYQVYAIATQRSVAVLSVMQTFTIQICLVFCMFVTAYQIVHSDLSIGSFTSVNAYVMQLFTPLAFLGNMYDQIVQAFVDMSNLSELLAEEPDITDPPDAYDLRLRDPQRGASIEFRDVCFSYAEQRSSTGISNVSFTVPAGTTTAIVGTTGAGKSTIARLLFRFYDIKGGKILVDGQDTSHVTQASLRDLIGVVPQDTVMFNDSLYHNIRYGNLDATLEDVENACRNAQILDFILSLKAQWETKVGERGLRLSGGEKQRVAIARALLKDPPIVLLDEATSALDTVKEQEIQGALRSLEKGRTTLVIAHRLSTVMHAEQIIVLDAGRIIERGTHEELLVLNGKYAQLWAQQATKANVEAAEAAARAVACAAEAAVSGAAAASSPVAPVPVSSSSSSSASLSQSGARLQRSESASSALPPDTMFPVGAATAGYGVTLGAPVPLRLASGVGSSALLPPTPPVRSAAPGAGRAGTPQMSPAAALRPESAAAGTDTPVVAASPALSASDAGFREFADSSVLLSAAAAALAPESDADDVVAEPEVAAARGRKKGHGIGGKRK